MTDHLPPHPDDEPDAIDLLVSRALDDDLNAEERARLEADADAAARLARMRAARDLVARVDPPSSLVTDAAVAAALRAADELWPVDVGPTTGTVVPFRRRRGWAAAAPWLGAVAAAGALVVGVATLGGGSDEQIAEKAPEASVGAEERTGAAADSADTEVVTEMATTSDGAGAGPTGGSSGGEDPDATAMSAPQVGEVPAETAPLAALPVVPADGLSAYATERSMAAASVCDPAADLLLPQALIGEPPVLVEVVRDATGVVAYDLVDCTEVARADLG